MSRPDPVDPAPLLRPVAALMLLWHLALALDYLNARLGWDPALPTLTGALMLPQLWATVGWGLAIWLGLAAAVFALGRDDASVLLMFAAAIGAGLAVAGDALATGAAQGAGDPLLGLPRALVLAALAVVPAAGWLYVRARHASGHLT